MGYSNGVARVQKSDRTYRLTTTSIDIKHVQLVLNNQFEDKLYNRNSIRCSLLENLLYKCLQSRLMYIKKYQENNQLFPQWYLDTKEEPNDLELYIVMPFQSYVQREMHS